MPWPALEIINALPAFALVLFRIGGLVMTAPLFASSIMPVRFRAGLALMASVIMFPIARRGIPADVSFAGALVGGVGELAVGVTIGLAFTVFMSVSDVIGLIVGQQAGISLGEVFNPALNDQSSAVGQLYGLALAMLILAVGGHRAMLAAVMDTYQFIPALSFVGDTSLVVLLTEMLAATFSLGLRLAAPVLIALLLTECALGMISRTIPQLNILTVGFAIRGMLALSVAALTLGLCTEPLVSALHDAVEMVRGAFGLPASARGMVI